MAQRHLTDFEVQEYLDGSLQQRHPLLALHAERCPRCQEELREYNRLYGLLSCADTCELSPDFARSVREEIDSMVTERRRSRLLDHLLFLGVGLVLASAAWYFVDLAALWSGLAQFGVLKSGNVHSLLIRLGELASQLQPVLRLLALSASVLLLMAALDAVLTRAGRRMLFLSI